jgi:hypothetical protein
MIEIGTAGSALCVNYANKQAGPSSGGAAPPSSTNVDAAKPSASNSAGGAKPAAGPTSTKNAAASERTFAAGALGLAALAFAL